VCNCTRDEGRSFEVGNQVLISSPRKLLSSKAMVVNCEGLGVKFPGPTRQTEKASLPANVFRFWFMNGNWLARAARQKSANRRHRLAYSIPSSASTSIELVSTL
jgi:hypothetical protein